MNKTLAAKWHVLEKYKETANYWLVWQQQNRFWINGFSASTGIIIIDLAKSTMRYFLDPRYFQQAQDEKIAGKIEKLEGFKKYWESLEGEIKIESDLSISLVKNLQHLNQKVKLIPFNYQILRMIKNESEIIKIRQACLQTTKVWNKIATSANEGKTETEVAVFIQKAFLDHACKASFDPIVASGPRTAYIHSQPTTAKIKDVLLCDFGGKVANYCADFTRTIVYDHTAELQTIKTKLMAIYHELLMMLKPGVQINKLIAHCQTRFNEQKWTLQHALGHGIGLEVHEEPGFWPGSEIVLAENMVIALEPGVYFPNKGGVRHEDTILITKTGYEILTNCD